jgi:hypothetical protein
MGRAGLPAFFYLGHRLSKFGAVTFVHQDRNRGEVELMHLDPARGPSRKRYFERTPWPVRRSDSSAAAALAVSSLIRPDDNQIREALPRVGGIVHAHSSARLGAGAVGPAMREIEEIVRATCDAYPERSALAVFVAGPAPLAFLLGRAINPRACRDVQVFEFDGRRYSIAYQLPYPPVPDRNKVLMFLSSPAAEDELRLGEEVRSMRLELGAGSVGDRLEIVHIPDARPADLLRGIRQHRPGALHFSGHGNPGVLLFQADDGNGRPVLTSELVEVLRHEGESIHLVVLGACYSESHAAALLEYVDCVAAMRGRVFDDDARRFSVAFYQQLAEGDSVRGAFEKARMTMRFERAADPGRSPARDVGVAGGESGREEELVLEERDEDCADRIFLVRRR